MEKSSFWQICLRNGVVAGIIICVFSLIMYLLGYDATNTESATSVGLLSTLVTIGAFAWGTHKGIGEYRKNNRIGLGNEQSFDLEASSEFLGQSQPGQTSFGRCVGFGTAIGLVGGIVQALYTYFFMAFISPEMVTDIKRNAVKEWERSGMNEEQIEQAIEYAGPFISPMGMSISALLMGLVFGVIVGVVAGIFMSNKKQQV